MVLLEYISLLRLPFSVGGYFYGGGALERLVVQSITKANVVNANGILITEQALKNAFSEMVPNLPITLGYIADTGITTVPTPQETIGFVDRIDGPDVSIFVHNRVMEMIENLDLAIGFCYLANPIKTAKGHSVINEIDKILYAALIPKSSSAYSNLEEDKE